MADAKPIKVVTPVGELHYVNITGQGKLNYNEDGYDYVATLHLKKDTEGCIKLTKAIDELAATIDTDKYELQTVGYKELIQNAEGKIFTPAADYEAEKGDEPTGIIAFAFKTNVTFPDGRPTVISVFNKDAQKVSMGDRLIGNGSKGAISGAMKVYINKKKAGISLFLKSIQLTEYVAYEGNAGFDKQEDGSFVAPEDAETGFTGKAEGDATPVASTKSEVKAKPRL